MVVSLIAIQTQALVQIWALAKPELRLTSVRTLTDATVEAVHVAFPAPAQQRESALESIAEAHALRIRWSFRRPTGVDSAGDAAVLSRLDATLRQRLGGAVRQSSVALVKLDAPFPLDTLRVVLAPGDDPNRYGTAPLAAHEPDILLPPNIRIVVQGADGSWLSIMPVGFEEKGALSGRPLIPILIGGLIIALFSIMTARTIAAPLHRLVEAARQIGRSREFVPVGASGLHEFAAVAHAFEEMQRRLLSFIDGRTLMLAAISHDLRSSLTRLRIIVEAGASADVRQALLREMDEMHMMLESTLAFAGGEANRSPGIPTDVAALLISVIDDASDAGRDVRYAGPDHAEIVCSPVALKRAFRNLVDNAVKYAGHARVLLEANDAWLRIEIADDGVGIPHDRRLDALTPFVRLDEARSGAIPGAGLGLTIAHDAVQRHGGTLELRSAPSGGLLVVVTLPK